MKLSIPAIIMVLTVSLSLYGCSKHKTNAPAALIGRWKFVEGSSGWSGKQTPATLGYDVYIEYKPSGNYELYHNATLAEHYIYAVYEGQSITSSVPVPIIHYSRGPLDESFIIRNDSLFLTEEAYDASSEIYVRVP